MINDKTILAVIPARSGSKGLPQKNIKNLCGKPLIAWSILTGLRSKYIDEIVVSTNSQDIADIALSYGASVPFLRPNELAQDESTSFNVLEHCVNFYKKINRKYDLVVMLEPTSPQREAEDIDASIEKLMAFPDARAIVGIARVESQHPTFLVEKDANDFIRGYADPDMKIKRRQEISTLYFFEGSLYVSYVDTLLEMKSFYHSKTLGFEMPKWKSFEIDDSDDFFIIEAFMQLKKGIVSE